MQFSIGNLEAEIVEGGELLCTFGPRQIAFKANRVVATLDAPLNKEGLEFLASQTRDFECMIGVLRFRLTHSDLPLVFLVKADPKPFRSAAFYDGKGSIIICDTRRPEFSNFFKVKRRMLRILKPQPESLPCKTLNFWREPHEPPTKASCRRGTHQAAPPARRDPLSGGARKICAACRPAHPARFDGPIRRHGARADIERVRKTARAAAL
jgi:hypothetical protein